MSQYSVSFVPSCCTFCMYIVSSYSGGELLVPMSPFFLSASIIGSIPEFQIAHLISRHEPYGKTYVYLDASYASLFSLAPLLNLLAIIHLKMWGFE